MRIGILGTRGIPNYYGGFEQFTEFFAVYLAQKGHEVYVYNSSNHNYKESRFKGVNLIHKYEPGERLGTFGQFIYDFNCIIDAKSRNFDILLQLGYTSSSIWHKLLPNRPIIITNMDGLEWKRSKYSRPVQEFLKYAEKLAVKSSHYLVSDSIGIQSYLMQKYKAKSKYIAYGAELFSTPNINILNQYGVKAYNYNMLIARLEPENNIETILDGVTKAKHKTPFLVIGKHNANKFGAYLKQKFKISEHIKFVGSVYSLAHLNNLRYYSKLYFHGHSVGGTNPSLLEAMASKAFIVAHNNEFNKSILNQNALYFKTFNHVCYIVDNVDKQNYEQQIINNYNLIKTKFQWATINKKYLEFFYDCMEKK